MTNITNITNIYNCKSLTRGTRTLYLQLKENFYSEETNIFESKLSCFIKFWVIQESSK